MRCARVFHPVSGLRSSIPARCLRPLGGPTWGSLVHPACPANGRPARAVAPLPGGVGASRLSKRKRLSSVPDFRRLSRDAVGYRVGSYLGDSFAPPSSGYLELRAPSGYGRWARWRYPACGLLRPLLASLRSWLSGPGLWQPGDDVVSPSLSGPKARRGFPG